MSAVPRARVLLSRRPHFADETLCRDPGRSDLLPTALLVSVSAELLEKTKANQTYLLFQMLSLKRPKMLPLDSLKPRIPAAR